MLREYLKSIADAIRTKLGSTDTINAQNFPSKVNEVYDKGRTDEWSDFWDAFQDYGKRTNYYYAFTSDVNGYWNDKNFKPKYDMQPTDMNRFMRRSGVTNLEKILEKQGVILDTSKASNMILAFGNMWYLEVVPPIDVSSATASNSASGLFSSDTKLHTIRKLTVAENVEFTNFFASCESLKNIIVEGVIGRSISFLSSPLTVESMKSIITHLKNYAGTSNAGTYILTLKDECKTAMANLGAIPEFNNKTYDAYITDIGWNLS